MKKILSTLMTALFAVFTVTMVSCEDEDKPNNGNGNGVGSGSNDGTVVFDMGEAYWQSADEVQYDWTVRILNPKLKLSSFLDNDNEQYYSFGIGYFPVGAENNHPQYFNGSNPNKAHHEMLSANADSTEFLFHSTMKIDNRKEARAYVYLSDGEFHYSNVFYIEPQGGGQGDTLGNIGVAMPELVGSTAKSITVKSHFTGNITSAEPFKNATCGFIWCAESEGGPTIDGGKIIDCTQSAWQNNGQYFEGTIEGLEEGYKYNIAAWLRMTPESDYIIGDWRTMKAQDGGGNPEHGDTNWVTLGLIQPMSSTSISVTMTGYFDNNPSGLGVVYNTTGNPTTSDSVYNAFDHINMQTGEHDATVLSIAENKDGSRTATILLSGLKPETTYYFRSYMQFSGGTLPTIYSEQKSEKTIAIRH
jgi:hypothetical protein